MQFQNAVWREKQPRDKFKKHFRFEIYVRN